MKGFKFYRIHFYTSAKGSEGYEFFTSDEAVKRARRRFLRNNPGEDETTIEAVTVLPTKRGIIDALNFYGGHADNG